MASHSRRPGLSTRVAHGYALLQARGLNKRKLATAGAALLALSVGYHVIFGANGITVYEQKRHETRALDVEMKQLQQENDQLQGHVQRLQSDPGEIEHEAREQLHYARPGEVIYTLPAPSPSANSDGGADK